MRRADRLVVVAVFSMLLPAWVALVGFDALVAFAGEIDEFGQGGYGAGNALLSTLYTLPRRFYQLFPPAALIGCLMGLGTLAASSELTALRALGLSRWRICLGAAAAVAALTLGMMLVAETIGPAGEQRAQALVLAAKTRDVAVAKWSGLWARDGDTFVNARQGRVEGKGARAFVILDDVRLYEFADNRLAAIALARRAEYRDGQWTLLDVRRTVLEAHGAHTVKQARQPWTSHLDPAVLSLTVARPRYLSTRDIATGLAYQRRNGLDTGLFESAYWSRFFYPVNALVLCLCAMPFAFGALRSGGAGKRLFLGVVLGLAYFTLQTLAINTAEVYRFDLRVGNLLPPLLAAVAAWLYFRRRA
jgi:lipopolysaccharide export system permease protein